MACCENDHQTLRAPEVWHNLRSDGFQRFGDAVVDYRRCPFCGTSLAEASDLKKALACLAETTAVNARTLGAI